jgi:hypothetical protein
MSSATMICSSEENRSKYMVEVFPTLLRKTVHVPPLEHVLSNMAGTQ